MYIEQQHRKGGVFENKNMSDNHCVKKNTKIRGRLVTNFHLILCMASF